MYVYIRVENKSNVTYFSFLSFSLTYTYQYQYMLGVPGLCDVLISSFPWAFSFTVVMRKKLRIGVLLWNVIQRAFSRVNVCFQYSCCGIECRQYKHSRSQILVPNSHIMKLTKCHGLNIQNEQIRGERAGFCCYFSNLLCESLFVIMDVAKHSHFKFYSINW